MSVCVGCNQEDRWESDWDTCNECGGSGKDNAQPDGRCVLCHGEGDVDRGGYVCGCDPCDDEECPASYTRGRTP